MLECKAMCLGMYKPMCVCVFVVVCELPECCSKQASRAHKSWHYQWSGLGHPCVLLLNVIVAGRPLGRYFLVRNQDQSRRVGEGVGEEKRGEERRRMVREQ